MKSGSWRGVRIGLFLLAGLFATGTPWAQKPEATMIDTPIASATKFGFNLFGELARSQPEKNIFVSPTSVALALAMTYNGAGGATGAAMADVLQLKGVDLAAVNQAYASLASELQDPGPQVRLSVANSLWLRAGLRVKPDFLNGMRDLYRAKITELDFASPQAAPTINGWVKEQTQGKIPEIVSRLNSRDALLLINAIYFKGKWQKVFDPAKTHPAPFHLAGGGQKDVQMMAQKGEFGYFKGEGFEAVRLPYGEGRLSMIVFLPEPASDLKKFLAGLTAESWNLWLPQLRPSEGEIQLPRFRMEYETDLDAALKKLGMAVAFEPGQADFSRMITPPPSAYISQVRHKTFVEVNEEGTEAAAATSVRIGLTSVRVPTPPFRMIVDRPFFCAIHDQKTGALLFMGAIVNP